MYISYSGYKLYVSCPRAYWHRYINKTKSPPDNRVHMLYGETVGILFERFYSDRFWKQGESAVDHMLSLVDKTMDTIIRRETARGGIFDWEERKKDGSLKLKKDTRSVEAVAETVREAIPKGVASIRRHRLLGPKSVAEIKLDSNVESHRLGGRADFLIERVRPHSDRVLIDGKGSRWRDEYVDNRQVKWYAMLHREKYGTLPDRLGFLYWRCEPEESLDWIECSDQDADSLKETVLTSLTQIEINQRRLLKEPGESTLGEVFPVKPTDDCKLCSYLEGCPQGRAFVEKKVPLPEGIGVEDIGMG